ncbi:RING-type domain-containing protein [Mycena indigotica]|uniref:RING-type domain-containing protein n=1 Tax=Mycena indigotica TaxID=2126181 RepID=A0A8H6S6I9_9AGAR|nr:RING-type domain-containing protein [Mycena indigotica]KAF7292722.1 RING-type domain-containing protein [Mycena indigotica]
MANCSICYERFSAPVSLPCGHIFCRDCLRTTVDAIKSPSLEHYCPACRTPYSVVTIDAALVPPYLRPHILPPIRPVFFDHVSSPKIKPVADSLPESLALPKTTTDSSPHSQPSSSGSSFLPTSPSSPSPATSPASLPHTPVIAQSLRQIPEANSSMTSLRRNAAEADALRMACQTWRHRAEVHAAANSGLLSFARAARNAAIKMRGERDDLKRRVEVLQRQLMEVMATELPGQNGCSPNLWSILRTTASRSRIQWPFRRFNNAK